MRETSNGWFKKRRREQDLARRHPGDQFWITDMKVNGTVSARVDTPWSYLVQTPRGLLQRHRTHLVTLNKTPGSVQPELENFTPDATATLGLVTFLNNHAAEKQDPTREKSSEVH